MCHTVLVHACRILTLVLSKVGEKIGEKSIKGRVGMAMSVFSPVRSVNSDVWSYRKVGETAAKLERREKSARKIEQKLKPRNIAKQVMHVAKP